MLTLKNVVICQSSEFEGGDVSALFLLVHDPDHIINKDSIAQLDTKLLTITLTPHLKLDARQIELLPPYSHVSLPEVAELLLAFASTILGHYVEGMAKVHAQHIRDAKED